MLSGEVTEISMELNRVKVIKVAGRLSDIFVKQRRPVTLAAVPVAFPELARVHTRVLDDEWQHIVQEREHTTLLPLSKIGQLPLRPDVREQSEQLLHAGKEAQFGNHISLSELDDCLSLELG